MMRAWINSMILYRFQCYWLLVLVFAIICVSEAFAKSGNITHDVGPVELAWLHYESGDYAKSREIINDNYDEKDLGLSLLSGMLYAKKGSCNKAISSIEYVTNYFRNKKVGIEQDSQINEYYMNLKLLEIDCYQKLGDWLELHQSLTEYIPYSSGIEKLDKLVMLGDAKLMLSESGVTKGIRACETVIKEIKGGGLNDYKEQCLYVLSELYTLSGRRVDAAQSFIDLLGITDDKKSWVLKLQSSQHSKWILENPIVSEMLKKPENKGSEPE